MLVVFLLREVCQRHKGIVVARIVIESERPDGHSVLEHQIVAAAGFVENVAEPVLANDSGANFKLFISHKNTTRQHLTTRVGVGQEQKA